MKLELNKPVINVSVEDLAKALSQANNAEQAKFFNTFNKELLDVCGSDHYREMQTLTFTDLLDESGKDLINNIHGFLNMPK